MSADNNLDSILLNILGEKKQPETIGDTVRFVPSTPVVAEAVAKPEQKPMRGPVDKVEIDGASNQMVEKVVVATDKGWGKVVFEQKKGDVWGYGKFLVPVIKALFADKADEVLVKMRAAGFKD